ncbi:MAG: hypothetical protein K1X66_01970 [Verrucomicrobiae bacterium]|nr:hypothetical protein [Verrucomicrobiae bacterium]
MAKISFQQALEQIVILDSRYSIDAYQFMKEALDFTTKILKKNSSKNPAPQHITGQELLEGIRIYTLKQYGPMGKTLLEYWGLRQCEDFGQIVFNLVNLGVFGKTESDSLEDFKKGYDFDEAFVKPFLPEERRTSIVTLKTRKNLKNKKVRSNKKKDNASKAPKL